MRCPAFLSQMANAMTQFRYDIPFNRPTLVGNEWKYLAEAIQMGHISGDGFYTHQCHDFLERKLGVRKALLTTSCTHALELAAMLIDLKEGDEVIVPTFSFVSTANAFALRGARPIFADIRPDTLNIDEGKISKLITRKTRAIVLVHYAGVGCDMDTILEIAGKQNLAVIEDNAHGLFGKYRGKFLGTFGCLAAQSFHETKNVTCGEGGALLINDPRFVERGEIIREKGTNRMRFFRGEVDKYSWVDLGSSYLPSDILAAFLYAQFEAHAQIQATRQRIWERYYGELTDWAKGNGVRLPIVSAECDQAYHLFYVLLPSIQERQRLIAHLKEHGILSVFHYVPLHTSKMGMRYGGRAGDCPVAETISERLVRLPFYNQLSETEQSRVIDTIRRFRI
jgi:dTDP-4-amino-4,6-dideoxygalactose transaminase